MPATDRHPLVSARYTDERGDYLMAIVASPGPCGSCRRMTTTFVTRGGRTECSGCDDRAGQLARECNWRPAASEASHGRA